MRNLGKASIYDLAAGGIIVLVTVLSLIRFHYLPQFLDDYYHLACAKGFLASGGWVGIDWWGAAPYGRPHIYPPLYHMLIVLFKVMGMNGITILRVFEVSIVPLFVIVLWLVLRKCVSDIFSFWFIVIITGFFSFYSAITSNIPASLAIIFGVLSWYFFWKGKSLSAALLAALIFYTHAGMCWVFFISYLVTSFFNPSRRKDALIISLSALGAASPLLYHQLHYFKYVRISVLREVMFSHFSIFIIVTAVVSFLLYFTEMVKSKKVFGLFFIGYLVGSLVVFFKYPYRLFGAQGIVGFVFFSAVLLETFTVRIIHRRYGKAVIGMVFLYLFFMHSTIDLEEGGVNLHPFNSTYYNLVSGKFIKLLEFNSLYYPRYYLPVKEVINKYTAPYSIIASNNRVVSQILAALTGRPVTTSLFVEVLPFRNISSYKFARIIYWIRPEDTVLQRLKKKLHLIKVYENDLGYVYLSSYNFQMSPLRAVVPFRMISVLGAFFIFIFVADNVKIVSKR